MSVNLATAADTRSLIPLSSCYYLPFVGGERWRRPGAATGTHRRSWTRWACSGHLQQRCRSSLKLVEIRDLIRMEMFQEARNHVMSFSPNLLFSRLEMVGLTGLTNASDNNITYFKVCIVSVYIENNTMPCSHNTHCTITDDWQMSPLMSYICAVMYTLNYDLMSFLCSETCFPSLFWTRHTVHGLQAEAGE